MLFQNSRLVHHQAQGNHLSHKRQEPNRKDHSKPLFRVRTFARAHSANGTVPSPISTHRRAAVGGALEAEIEGQDSSFLTAFSSAFHVPGGCCREYLVVSTDLHM